MKLQLVRIDFTRTDTLHLNSFLIRVVALITAPAFIGFALISDMNELEDFFLSSLLISMALAISFFLPIAMYIRNRAKIAKDQAALYYLKKILFFFGVTLASIFAFLAYMPESTLSIALFKWLGLPILIPYCMTSATFYTCLLVDKICK